MLLGYGYMKNSLVCLAGWSTHRDVANISDLFYFFFCAYMIMGNDALTKISHFEANWDEQKSL